MDFDDLDDLPNEEWDVTQAAYARTKKHRSVDFVDLIGKYSKVVLPSNGDEAALASQMMSLAAVSITDHDVAGVVVNGSTDNKSSKRKICGVQEIMEDKWKACEKAASQFESEVVHERGCSKYIDVATGMRLRYARFGGETNRTAIILHDTMENGESYYGLAKQVADKGGFSVYCIDFRGHGDSTNSREGQYDVPSFVADIESFIVELDLYTHPVALIGFGLGAIIATAFAGQHEHLVAGVTLIESHPRCREEAVAFHRFQNVAFSSLREAVTFEIAPIWADNANRNAKSATKRMLSKFRKPKNGDVSGVERVFSQGGIVGKFEFRIDPKFFFKTPSVDEYFSLLENVKCHASVYRGERSTFMEEKDLDDVLSALGRFPTPHSARKKTVRGKSIPETGHYIFEDDPHTLRDYILHSLLISESAMVVENNASRTPEFLNLKPLPQYATIEDAINALKPRKIPTKEDVMSALREAKSWDDVQSDDEDDKVDKNMTLLANNDSQYFGMVG